MREKNDFSSYLAIIEALQCLHHTLFRFVSLKKKRKMVIERVSSLNSCCENVKRDADANSDDYSPSLSTATIYDSFPPIFGPYFTSRGNKHTLFNPIFRYGCWHGAIKMLFPPLFSVANYDLRFSFSIVFFLRGFRIIKKRGWGATAISGRFFISPTSTLRFNPTSFDTQVNTSKNS